MKFNININQLGLQNDKEITLIDASVIDWLHTFCGTNNQKINSQKVDGWTWVNCGYLIRDMPLLRITSRAGASKLLHRLAELGYIQIKTDKKKLFVKTTDKIDELYLSKEVGKTKKEVVNRGLQSCKLGDTNTNTTNIILNNTSVVSKTNKELIEKEKDASYSFKEELDKLWKSPRLVDKIVALLWEKKKYNFENRKMFLAQLGRDRHWAVPLKGYNSEQLKKTMEFCNNKFEMWGMETIGKQIANVINRK